MAQIEIPAEWRRHVCRILGRGHIGREVVWTKDASQRFEEDYPDLWRSHAHEAFQKHLSLTTVTGCEVNMNHPAGTTYEFLFPMEKRPCYGKILLRPDQQTIYIFSAHRPRSKTLSCE